jgi:hypothetical protein
MQSKIILTFSELFQAAMVGVMREVASRKQGRRQGNGRDNKNSWSDHIEGAAGEQAFAKALNLYCHGHVNAGHSLDVGDFQVRTRSKCYYDLIIRSDDADDEKFVLVIGESPNFSIIGWIYGREGKRPEWLKEYGNRPAAWFVPQASLRKF